MTPSLPRLHPVSTRIDPVFTFYQRYTLSKHEFKLESTNKRSFGSLEALVVERGGAKEDNVCMTPSLPRLYPVSTMINHVSTFYQPQSLRKLHSNLRIDHWQLHAVFKSLTKAALTRFDRLRHEIGSPRAGGDLIFRRSTCRRLTLSVPALVPKASFVPADVGKKIYKLWRVSHRQQRRYRGTNQ